MRGGRETAFTSATLPGDSTQEGITNLKTADTKDFWGKSNK